MMGRICIKGAVIVTLALAAPLIRPAAAQNVSTCLVECTSDLKQFFLHCSSDVELQPQSSGCLDLVQEVIAVGFVSATSEPLPREVTKSGTIVGRQTYPSVKPDCDKLWWMFYKPVVDLISSPTAN